MVVVDVFTGVVLVDAGIAVVLEVDVFGIDGIAVVLEAVSCATEASA